MENVFRKNKNDFPNEYVYINRWWVTAIDNGHELVKNHWCKARLSSPKKYWI